MLSDEEIVALYVERGLSMPDINLLDGRTPSTIRYILLKNGVALRSRGRPKGFHRIPEDVRLRNSRERSARAYRRRQLPGILAAISASAPSYPASVSKLASSYASGFAGFFMGVARPARFDRRHRIKDVRTAAAAYLFVASRRLRYGITMRHATESVGLGHDEMPAIRLFAKSIAREVDVSLVATPQDYIKAAAPALGLDRCSVEGAATVVERFLSSGEQDAPQLLAAAAVYVSAAPRLTRAKVCTVFKVSDFALMQWVRRLGGLERVPNIFDEFVL